MRIAFVSDAYIPVPTGVAVSMETLRLSLERLGHTVYVFAPRFPGYRDANSHIARLPAVFSSHERYRPIRWPYLTQLKSKQIEQLKLDIVHSHYFFDYFKIGDQLARLANTPLVHTVYRITPEVYRKKTLWRSAQRNSELELIKMIKYLNTCDQIISLSRETKKYLEGFSISTPIENLPVGIFPKDYVSWPRDAVKEKFGIPKSRKLLLYVGRLDDDSNLGLLIRAFKRVWKALDEVHLLIIGDGKRLSFYQQLVETQAFSKFVTFAGFMPKKKVNRIYGAADVLACPNILDPEPLAIIESLAAGTPVVSVSGFGAQDFIKNESDGFVTRQNEEDFANAITELLRRDKMRLEFSLRARAASREFSSSNLTRDLVNLYDSLLKNHQNKIL